jgi:hypothetical protein
MLSLISAPQAGSFANAYPSSCPARLVLRAPLSLQLNHGVTEAASFTLSLPPATRSLFPNLHLQQSVPVRVRILLPAAATTREDAKRFSNEMILTMKADPGAPGAVNQGPSVQPSKVKLEPCTHQEHLSRSAKQEHSKGQDRQQQRKSAQGDPALPNQMITVAECDAHLLQSTGSSSTCRSKGYSLVGLSSHVSKYRDWTICVIDKVCALQSKLLMKRTQ